MLPVLLYQAYAFVAPAFNPRERRLVVPLILMVPILFIGGVAFCYLVVLTPALDFLLSFNASEFNTQLRASDYYDFATMLMIAMGLSFQCPWESWRSPASEWLAWTSCAAAAATRSSRLRCSQRSCPHSTR